MWFLLVRFKWNIRSLFGNNHIYSHCIESFGVPILPHHHRSSPSNHKIAIILSERSSLENSLITLYLKKNHELCLPSNKPTSPSNTFFTKSNLKFYIKFTKILKPLNFAKKPTSSNPYRKISPSLQRLENFSQMMNMRLFFICIHIIFYFSLASDVSVGSQR